MSPERPRTPFRPEPYDARCGICDGPIWPDQAHSTVDGEPCHDDCIEEEGLRRDEMEDHPL